MRIEPAVAFGEGLGYSTFEFGALEIPDSIDAGEGLTVRVPVTNTGARRGSEVVQVYVEPTNAHPIRPVRELKGFAKVTLDPGATTEIEIDLPPRSFAYFDPGDPVFGELSANSLVPAGGGVVHREQAGWYVDAGTYRIWVGRSSASSRRWRTSRCPATSASILIVPFPACRKRRHSWKRSILRTVTASPPKEARMFFGRDKQTMPEPDQALPGRSEAVPVQPAHLVLGTPLDGPVPEGHEVAVFGLGCFWGAERFYWQLPGVHTTAVGYAGGYTPNPLYEEVCTGKTGHNEVVRVVYDPAVVTYDDMLKIFWEVHDPTQFMRQGNDIGTQYRSEIYVYSEEQREAAEASKRKYQGALSARGFGEIETTIVDAPTFYFAEEYHQQYLHRNPMGYCNHGFCQVSYD